MARHKLEKANYKIFDKSVNRYISCGGRSKATWTSRTWVMRAAEYYCRGDKNYLLENIEIHIFPMKSAVKVPWHEMVMEAIKQTKEKREAEEAKKNAKIIEEVKFRLRNKIAENERENELMLKKLKTLELNTQKKSDSHWFQ
jgi:hypothetical protein